MSPIPLATLLDGEAIGYGRGAAHCTMRHEYNATRKPRTPPNDHWLWIVGRLWSKKGENRVDSSLEKAMNGIRRTVTDWYHHTLHSHTKYTYRQREYTYNTFIFEHLYNFLATVHDFCDLLLLPGGTNMIVVDGLQNVRHVEWPVEYGNIKWI